VLVVVLLVVVVVVGGSVDGGTVELVVVVLVVGAVEVDVVLDDEVVGTTDVVVGGIELLDDVELLVDGAGWVELLLEVELVVGGAVLEDELLVVTAVDVVGATVVVEASVELVETTVDVVDAKVDVVGTDVEVVGATVVDDEVDGTPRTPVTVTRSLRISLATNRPTSEAPCRSVSCAVGAQRSASTVALRDMRTRGPSTNIWTGSGDAVLCGARPIVAPLSIQTGPSTTISVRPSTSMRPFRATVRPQNT
jgi:hypothetical protein